MDELEKTNREIDAINREMDALRQRLIVATRRQGVLQVEVSRATYAALDPAAAASYRRTKEAAAFAEIAARFPDRAGRPMYYVPPHEPVADARARYRPEIIEWANGHGICDETGTARGFLSLYRTSDGSAVVMYEAVGTAALPTTTRP
jgi:hypothetical protein